MMKYDRQKALNLLKEYTKSDSLLRHAYALEQVMRKYAQKFDEDEDKWGVTGLLHDFDYEKYPTAEEHPFKGAEILKEKGFDDEFIKSILSHADYSGEPRDILLKKVLFACDELAGFITAVTYVRPSKSIDEVKVSSVKKKMKDKGFARAVNRDDILNGSKEINVDLDEHIQFCIDAMKKNKIELGL